ncbi:hypothetical protein Q9L58_010263 [Maublancomyces gigas]|uniref:Uncharacterized protein n=1 Tax=Discina gigas TaxID=1032678 RepID=A0ABR3G4M5_9PEZI
MERHNAPAPPPLAPPAPTPPPPTTRASPPYMAPGIWTMDRDVLNVPGVRDNLFSSPRSRLYCEMTLFAVCSFPPEKFCAFHTSRHFFGPTAPGKSAADYLRRGPPKPAPTPPPPTARASSSYMAPGIWTMDRDVLNVPGVRDNLFSSPRSRLYCEMTLFAVCSFPPEKFCAFHTSRHFFGPTAPGKSAADYLRRGPPKPAPTPPLPTTRASSSYLAPFIWAMDRDVLNVPGVRYNLFTSPPPSSYCVTGFFAVCSFPPGKFCAFHTSHHFFGPTAPGKSAADYLRRGPPRF